MKNIQLIVALSSVMLTAFIQKASAQFYFYDNDRYDSPVMFEVGGSVGVMNCFTDIGGGKGLGQRLLKDLNLGNNRFNGSIYVSALYKYAVGFRLEGTFGQVKAYDSILKPIREATQGRYERNLNFRSKITELSLIAEFHPLFIFINWLNREDNPPRLSPYVAVGVGIFSFNPQGRLRNNWIDLQPLSLEGQGFEEYPGRKPYKLTQMNIPLGLGFKYELTPAINLRAEALYRILSTDYLDDVSMPYIDAALFQKYFSGVKLQNALNMSYNDRTNPGGPTGQYRKAVDGLRGDPKNRDSYFTFNIKVGITFGREQIKHAGGPQRF